MLDRYNVEGYREQRPETPGNVRGCRGTKMSKRESQNIDHVAARELMLYVDNSERYVGRVASCIRNQQRRIRRGDFDLQKAVKVWLTLCWEAAKDYVAEFGTHPSEARRWFPLATRIRCAEMLQKLNAETIERGPKS